MMCVCTCKCERDITAGEIKMGEKTNDVKQSTLSARRRIRAVRKMRRVSDREASSGALVCC